MKRFGASAALVASLFISSASPADAAITLVGAYSPITIELDKGDYTITPAKSNSPGAWSFTPDDPTVVKISGLVVTPLKAGQTRITATLAAANGYNSVTRYFRLYVRPGTPRYSAWAPLSYALGTNSARLIPPQSTSDGEWSYTSSDNTIASISGEIVTFNDGGVVTITGTQRATTNWLTGSVQTTLTITALKPSLGTFSDITLTLDSVANLKLTPPSSTSSGTWSFISSNPSVATVSGDVLTPKAAGTTEITAKQARKGSFGSSSVKMTVKILAVEPTVGTFKNLLLDLDAGQIGNIAVPPSNSPGVWSFTSSDPAVATVNGIIVRPLKAGTTTVTAIQAASGTFAAFGPTQFTVTVTATPTLSSASNMEYVFGDPNPDLPSFESNSTSPITYSSNNEKVAKIDNGKIALVGAGVATITAQVAANAIWKVKTSSFQVRIIGSTPTVGKFESMTIVAGTIKKIVAPLSNSDGPWAYSSSNPLVAAIDGTTIKALTPGAVSITAIQQPSGRFDRSNIITFDVRVTPAPVVNSTPSAKPTPTPSPTIETPRASAFGGFQVIKIYATNPSVTVLIDGKRASLGTNRVTSGKHKVVVRFGAKTIFAATITVK